MWRSNFAWAVVSLVAAVLGGVLIFVAAELLVGHGSFRFLGPTAAGMIGGSLWSWGEQQRKRSAGG
jgi:hypothetical protein